MLRILAALVLWTGAAEAAEIVLEGSRFVVRDAPDAARIRDARFDKILQITVAGNDDQPMAGSYAVIDGNLSFQPQFPLTPGVTYRARYAFGAESATATITLPKAAAVSTASVTRVYPTTDVLPENALKFYIHFSAPMPRGNSYQWLRLIDEKDGQVELPFLELEEELWDEDQRRLTVWLDPGRIKRGLVPNYEVGPPLREGHRYRLEIDGRWPDASGAPLTQGFAKSFRVAAPARQALDVKDWQVAAPQAGSAAPLTITFPQPLDHALLQRVVRVVDARGAEVRGQIMVDQDERRWTLVPSAPWRAGAYAVKAAQSLEDVAGNKINRPFDADIPEKGEAPKASVRFYELPFTVGEP